MKLKGYYIEFQWEELIFEKQLWQDCPSKLFIDYLTRLSNWPNLVSIEKEFHHHQTFTPEEEKELALYLIVAQKLNLTPRKTRELAFIYDKANAIEMPFQWNKYESAGEDWFAAFLKRNANLSTCKPERTSQATALGSSKPSGDWQILWQISRFVDKVQLSTSWNI